MNQNIYDVSIEKAILSSIIFDNTCFEEVVNILKPEDFYHLGYQKIFETMKLLDKKDLPIEEDFLRKHGAEETNIIEVMSANPITNLFAYAKQLKIDSNMRKITQLSIQLRAEYKESYIDEIQKLKDEINELDDARKLKSVDQKSNSFFDKHDLDPDFVENAKFEYLYQNFLVKNEITMVAARPAIGKSLTVFSLSWMAIQRNAVDTVFYLDGDNGITTIKERKIHHIKQKAGKKLRYFQGKTSAEFGQIIKELLKIDLTNCLVVFDSIKNFMLGGDRDKNKDVSKVMEVLKRLRNNGATVVFLHHSNKPQKDIDDLMYAGSSAWEEDTSNAFILKRNEDKNAFIFHAIKKRTGEIDDQAFTYDSENHWLNTLDLEYAKRTKDDEEMIGEIIDFISDSRQPPIWSDIYNYLLSIGYEKNKASKAIKNGENIYWRCEKGNGNNRKLFFLTQEVIQNQEKNKKSASGSPISSGSPIYGVSNLSHNNGEVRDVVNKGPIITLFNSNYQQNYQQPPIQEIDVDMPDIL